MFTVDLTTGIKDYLCFFSFSPAPGEKQIFATI